MRINLITESQIVNIETQVKDKISIYKQKIAAWDKLLPVLKDAFINKRIVYKVAPLFPEFEIYYHSDTRKFINMHYKGSTNYQSDLSFFLCNSGESRLDMTTIELSIESHKERISKYEHQLELLRRNLAVLNALAEPINESMEEIHDIMFFSHDGAFGSRYTFSNNY